MKALKYIASALAGVAMTVGMTSCTDLDEITYDRIDASAYYQDEASVKGALAAIYYRATESFLEYFWYLNEYSADQICWRTWNGGAWGWDDAQKFVVSTHTWNSEASYIKSAWEGAWGVIGLCNNIIADLEEIDPASINMTREQLDSYIAEARTMRAWAYYNNFELWGGALPIFTAKGGEVPGSADTDFNTGCKKLWDFMVGELDDCVDDMMVESGNGNTRGRMNKMVNRMLKMRLLLNSELWTGTARYNECAELCQKMINGDFGSYSLSADYRDIYGMNNMGCPEVVFAFAQDESQLWTNDRRNTPGLPYNYDLIFDCEFLDHSGWNCVCLVPSKDNSGTLLPNGGTENPKSFVFDYGDKLGAVMDRISDKDIRKQNFYCDDAGNWRGNFLIGAQYARTSGEVIPADADRDGEPLVYVDQVGTFKNLGRQLETVMSPRWGETNSGIRHIKYPMYPSSVAKWTNSAEVEFRLAEVYYTLAECKLRAGNSAEAKQLVNSVRSRYFNDKSQVDNPGPGFSQFNLDWMLSEWGIEFLGEGRRRRTDLRRFDQFTQGQWWFFGRATESDRNLPAKRDRKYEWFPLPETALMVNPGLVQNPNY